MFAHEIKVKRKSKIKSRKFHQILKKENAKKSEKFLKGLEASDPAAVGTYRRGCSCSRAAADRLGSTRCSESASMRRRG